MNNQAQTTAIFGIMLAVVIIILALEFAPILTDTSATARNNTDGDLVGMDCSNSSISDFQKAACITTDISPFWIIGVIILIGGGFVGARVIFN